ncbi:hypothetical protein, partial [Alistipes putredinis]
PDRAGVFGVFCIARNPARKDSPANDRKKEIEYLKILLVQGRWNAGDDVKRLSATCRQPLRFGFADNFEQAACAVFENLPDVF